MTKSFDFFFRSGFHGDRYVMGATQPPILLRIDKGEVIERKATRSLKKLFQWAPKKAMSGA